MTKKISMKIFCPEANSKWMQKCLLLAAFFCLLLNTAHAESIDGSATTALQMEKTITGVVIDEFGDPVIGASVSVAGTTNGTITDIDGKFSLVSVPDNATINVSYIGYQTQTIRLDGRSIYSITLKEDSKLIDEVVVIGYGTTTRKHIIGAVDQVGAKMIEKRPVANVTQALQGASANLIIQQRSMNPNDNTTNINIRGISTINNNSPLIVIDGMVSEADRMNLLNPNDIENVSVLKDAGTAAIYGSRSANGVILITTKKGRADMKPVISFNASVGSQTPDILLKPIPGYQNAMFRNDARINSGLNPIYGLDEINEFARVGDREWDLNAIMQGALQQNYNLSVQGGSKNTTYMVSFGYYDQESNFVGPDYGVKKYNFRTNLVTDIGRLKLTTVLAYNRHEGINHNGTSLIADAMRSHVYGTYPLKTEDGKYLNNDVTTGGNVLATLEKGGQQKTIRDNLQAIVNADFDIWNGLKAKAMIGIDIRPEHREIKRSYWPVYSYANHDRLINSTSSKNYTIEDFNSFANSLNVQFLLDYNRTFQDKHTVTAMAGYSNESFRQRNNELKKNYVDSDLYIPIDETIIDEGSYNSTKGTTERSIYSWFGRIGYSYMDKYYAEFSARYDGSSKFGPDKRWGFFPSVSAGWRVTDEEFASFWKEKVGDAKIRASYGVLGNQSVGEYQYVSTFEYYTNDYAFNDKAVTTSGYQFGNPALHWETTRTFNIGFDLTFLNNSLTTSLDFFNKQTKDILMQRLLPGTLGGAIGDENIGAMDNRGWEITINYNLRHRDFHHSFGLNLGDSFNKVVDLGEQRIEKSDEIERIVRKGVPLYSYYGYKTDGIFRNEDEIANAALPIGAKVAPGDIRYVDRNGDGIINENDRFILGNAFPRYTFGFNYNLEWKGIDFGMFWQGVGKREQALRGEMVEPFHGSYYFLMFEHQMDYWTPNNPDAKYPRLTSAGSASHTNNYTMGSDFHIYNAAYLRLKNIQIGYTLPKNITKKVGVNKVRFYLNGQNLLTFNKNKFIDPESSEFGTNMNASGANSGRNYPVLKYYGGGIDIEF